MAVCMLCGKTPITANSIPKSVHKTARTLHPNIQKVRGIKVCTRCARTMRKYQIA